MTKSKTGMKEGGLMKLTNKKIEYRHLDDYNE